MTLSATATGASPSAARAEASKQIHQQGIALREDPATRAAWGAICPQCRRLSAETQRLLYPGGVRQTLLECHRADQGYRGKGGVSAGRVLMVMFVTIGLLLVFVGPRWLHDPQLSDRENQVSQAACWALGGMSIACALAFAAVGWISASRHRRGKDFTAFLLGLSEPDAERGLADHYLNVVRESGLYAGRPSILKESWEAAWHAERSRRRLRR